MLMLQGQQELREEGGREDEVKEEEVLARQGRLGSLTGGSSGEKYVHFNK